MTMTRFLMDWALRSSILVLAGALLLRMLRVKDPAVKLAALSAMLCGSLAIPALTMALPKIPFTVVRNAPPTIEAPVFINHTVSRETHSAPPPYVAIVRSFDWARAAASLYLLIACVLLSRLCVGLVMSRRLLRASRATGRKSGEIEIRESDGLSAPVALGISRPIILLPADWHSWDETKLAAVLAHETSHIQRKDPAFQLLSTVHRALLWHSPLSWFLHQRIVRTAEEASDDAALAVTRDRESYAEVLLDFMRRGVRGAQVQGVAMARYDQPAERINRILDGASLSRGVTRWSALAILVGSSSLAYLVAAVQTQSAALVQSPVPVASAAPVTAVAPQAAEASKAEPVPAAAPKPSRSIRRYMIVSGNSMSGSWDSNDRADEQELRSQFGRNFVWFRQGRHEYVVTDAGVLAELDAAMAPQREVNRLQDEVNKLQDVVNQHQTAVNRSQDGVNAMQNAANRRQDLMNKLQSAKGDDELIHRLEATLAELRANKGDTNSQDAVNRAQAKVNEMQSHINEEQHRVNDEQHKVNEAQHQVSSEMDGRVEGILDSAVQRHVAKQLP